MAAPKLSPASPVPDEALISGAYAVLGSQPLAGMGGGLPAYAVADRRQGRTDLMAVRVAVGRPARAHPLTAMAGTSAVHIANLLPPLAFGPGTDQNAVKSCFVICSRPPGPSVWPDATGDAPQRPWSETDLLDNLIRPVAIALEALANRAVTHRAIRPDNMFRAGIGSPVTLGCAWAAPPASLQPALFEPPYSAMCHPCGRGEGVAGDDVYALGVLMVALATGQMPMAGLDDEAIIRRKLSLGSFAAIVGDKRLPPAIHDLARGMLAEDPDHRSPPALLADPAAARVRRVTARPSQRARSPLELGGFDAWDARGLSYAMSRVPDQAARLLRGPTVDNWLRRVLPDAALASRVEGAVRARAGEQGPDATGSDAVRVMRVVAILDPLAPLCWRGLAMFPDGLGPMLADASEHDADGTVTERLEGLVSAEAISLWGEMRPERSEVPMLRLDGRQHRLLLRISGWAGGLARLRYTLNPLLQCRSVILRSACVARIGDLLLALDGAAVHKPERLIDREIGAFVAARFTGRADSDLAILAQEDDPDIDHASRRADIDPLGRRADIDPLGRRAMAELRILADLQQRDQGAAVPALAAAMHLAVTPALRLWRSRTVRAGREQALAKASRQGNLSAMVVAMDDQTSRADDARASERAAAELRKIEMQLVAIADAIETRGEQARNTGQEVAAALGLMALAASAVAAALT